MTSSSKQDAESLDPGSPTTPSLNRSVSPLSMSKDSLDSSRRVSLDLEQQKPRKRLAMGLGSESDSESEDVVEIGTTALTKSEANGNPVDIGSEEDADIEVSEVLEVEKISVAEVLDVSERSSDSGAVPIQIDIEPISPSQIIEEVTGITDAEEGQSMMGRLLSTLDSNQPYAELLETYVSQCRRAIQWGNPQSAIVDLTEYLTSVVDSTEEERGRHWALAVGLIDALPDLAEDLWYRKYVSF